MVTHKVYDAKFQQNYFRLLRRSNWVSSLLFKIAPSRQGIFTIRSNWTGARLFRSVPETRQKKTFVFIQNFGVRQNAVECAKQNEQKHRESCSDHALCATSKHFRNGSKIIRIWLRCAIVSMSCTSFACAIRNSGWRSMVPSQNSFIIRLTEADRNIDERIKRHTYVEWGKKVHVNNLIVRGAEMTQC